MHITCLQSDHEQLGMQPGLEPNAQDALLLSDAVGYAHASIALAEKLGRSVEAALGFSAQAAEYCLSHALRCFL